VHSAGPIAGILHGALVRRPGACGYYYSKNEQAQGDCKLPTLRVRHFAGISCQRSLQTIPESMTKNALDPAFGGLNLACVSCSKEKRVTPAQYCARSFESSTIFAVEFHKRGRDAFQERGHGPSRNRFQFALQSRLGNRVISKWRRVHRITCRNASEHSIQCLAQFGQQLLPIDGRSKSASLIVPSTSR
jgi:hypothetical protein